MMAGKGPEPVVGYVIETFQVADLLPTLAVMLRALSEEMAV